MAWNRWRICVPTGTRADSIAQGHTMDTQVKAVRNGWLPFYPQFSQNPLLKLCLIRIGYTKWIRQTVKLVSLLAKPRWKH